MSDPFKTKRALPKPDTCRASLWALVPPPVPKLVPRWSFSSSFSQSDRSLSSAVEGHFAPVSLYSVARFPLLACPPPSRPPDLPADPPPSPLSNRLLGFHFILQVLPRQQAALQCYEKEHNMLASLDGLYVWMLFVPAVILGDSG